MNDSSFTGFNSIRQPYCVLADLHPRYATKFYNQFSSLNWLLESIWRRTQELVNRTLSGWQSEADQRRKMLHHRDHYRLHANGHGRFNLLLEEYYLWTQYAAPADEIQVRRDDLLAALNDWQVMDRRRFGGAFRQGSLVLDYETHRRHPQDLADGRSFPANYETLDVTVSMGQTVSAAQRHKPWGILRSGIRHRDIRGNPWMAKDPAVIFDYLPCQVEVGCGPSLEQGIPPLHALHRTYHITSSNGQFCLYPEQDGVLNAIGQDPENFFTQATEIPRRAVLGEPGPFYRLLRRLRDQGLVVEPVITNNFDQLPRLVGLQEHNVRSYADTDIVPHIDFHPAARSLLVVGVHADRRRIQRAARRQGLKVIYVDPEGFWEDGDFRHYPLESATDEDILLPMTASRFAHSLEVEFNPVKGQW